MLGHTLSCWKRLLGWAGADESQGQTEDRRGWGRLRCDTQAMCHLVGSPLETCFPTRVRNISRGGIGLQISQALEPGQLLRITVPHLQSDSETEVLACVVRCDRSGQGLYEVGCTFSSPLEENDLKAFLASNTIVLSDRRSAPRLVCQVQVRFQVFHDQLASNWISAQIVDISASGIALQVSQEHHVGELLNIELHKDNQVLLTVLASVVRSAHQPGDGWIIGCNFIQELSEKVLERLRD